MNAHQPSGPLAFHVMAKPTGPICNLDCKYCFYLEKEKLYPANSNWAMPQEVLESFIRQKIAAQQVPVVSFAWQGGEPTLLGVDYFEKVVALQRKYSNGKKIENALQTNGVLLNDAWGEFLARNDFLVGLSLDGPRELHDHYRVNKGGRPTFDQVMRGLAYLKKHQVRFNTLTAVHRHNANHALRVYRFLKEVGSGFMQFIPIVERIARAQATHGLTMVPPDFKKAALVSAWSVEPVPFGEFLCAIFDEWVRQDVGKYFVQLFEVALESWMGMAPSLCVFRETCGDALALEHNGDLYSCDHYVFPENRLGNIMENPLLAMISSAQQQKFGTDKRDALPRYCRECEVRFACNGECPKNRFLKTPDGEYGLNYLCAGYKMFFHHIHPYMQFMAEELRHQRPPANVMAWTRERDDRSRQMNPPRNAPCPCGSGKKYKNCCGARAA
ncbi:MAG: anaerobic sulfatase-maturation protein [candidate division KSB1 bacterium]|nr:anaerobic sulfatase-maturation protein [candidate division KSB1 bacterium]MDZ7303890.1 anaerobic sulfatase-maturation protein [candidate division KSB1 bacterium]MDZ7313186.1 anaerobic sulfatase-maturation protein [candidate division KSB1 bacterium]